MVVKGDHTYLDMVMAIVPPQTECVVFSIDGSFMASVSVSGKDPKVRPGENLNFAVICLISRLIAAGLQAQWTLCVTGKSSDI